MKKCFVFNMILLLTMIFSSYCAFADSSFKSYSLDEAGITVSIPQDYAVFTRETTSGDSKLGEYGLTYDGIMAMFEAHSIYLDAFDSEGTLEIVVIAEETKDKSFSECSENELSQMSDTEESHLRSEGATVKSSDMFETQSAEFIKTYFEDKDGYDAVQYFTVSAGRKICIRISSYSGDLTDDAITLSERITQSVTFNKPSPVASPEVEPDEPSEESETSSEPEPEAEETVSVSSDAGETENILGGIPNYVLYIIIGILVIIILIALIIKK